MGISNQSNIILNENDYADVCAAVIAGWFIPNDPDTPRTADAYEVDDATRPLTNYNALNAALNVQSMKNYYPFSSSLAVFATNVARADSLPDFLDLFEAEFPGKKLAIEQMTFSSGNVFRLKVGQGLLITKAIAIAIRENIARGNLISDLTIYNISQMIAGNGDTYPLLDFMQLAADLQDNLGVITVTIDPEMEGAENLYSFGVKTSTGVSVYVWNLTEEPVTLPSISIDAEILDSVAAVNLHGLPTDDTAQSEATATGSVIFQPYSLTKITD
jgi:hypothetical protein